MSQVVRRFAAEPALAEAFAQRNQAETAARIRETAVAKGLDPDAPGFQWHEAFQIDDKKARAFHRTNEKLAAEPGPAERAAFDAWKRSCAEAAPVDPEPLVASGRCSRARTRRGSRKNCVWRRLSPPPAGTTKDRRAKSRAKTGS